MSAQYGSLPFPEQIKFFRAKELVPTDRWADLWKSAHDDGFMVAGMAKADLLADVHQALLGAIEQGTAAKAFQAEFDAIIDKYGWSGRGTGSTKGRAWRANLIYDTNLRTSYQAGRWAQVQQVKATRPYLIYRHSDVSVHPRPLHQSWDGLVVAQDSDWVKTHWPPNGWGCKCKMFALSDRDIKKLGKDGPDTPPDDGIYDWVDKVTGETHTVPVGIDPGWDYAPGATRSDLLQAQMARKKATLPPAIAAKLPDAPPPTWPTFGPRDATLDTIKQLGGQRLDDWLGRSVSVSGNEVGISSLAERPWEDLAEQAVIGPVRAALFDELKARVRTGGVSVSMLNAGGAGRKVLAAAAARFPDAWVSVANAAPVRVGFSKGRGYYMERKYNRSERRDEPYIHTDDSSTAVHEYAHHLQHKIPGLDVLFQAEHDARTAGDPLEVLFAYAKKETGRPDDYVDRYQGRVYSHGGALEVLTMAYQGVLGDDKFANELLAKMLKFDREILKVALGALFHFKP